MSDTSPYHNPAGRTRSGYAVTIAAAFVLLAMLGKKAGAR